MIWLLFSRRRREEFKRWFRAPAKWWERILSVLASAILFAVFGFVAFLFLGPASQSLEELLHRLSLWGGLAATAGVVLSLTFPKAMLCFAYPFSLIGSGDLEVH